MGSRVEDSGAGSQLQQLRTVNRFEDPFDTSSGSLNPLSLASITPDPNKDKVSMVIISLVEQLAAAYEQEDERRVLLAKCRLLFMKTQSST